MLLAEDFPSQCSLLLQLKRVNSLGSWGGCYLLQWGRGRWKKPFIYSRTEWVCIQFLNNLCGESLSLASMQGKRRTWAAVSSALLFLCRHKLSPYSGADVPLLHWPAYGSMHPEGHLGCLHGITVVDPCPLPWLQGGQPDSVSIRCRHANTGCSTTVELSGELAN